MVNVAKLIDTALAVRLALAIRQQDLQLEAAARRGERERERLFRGWRPPRIRSPSPEVEEVRVVRCFAMRVIWPEEDDSSEEFEVEEPEELDDSALAQTMDAEELLADDRAEREVSEMLRWYAQSVPGQVIGSWRAREDSTERLILSIVEYILLALAIRPCRLTSSPYPRKTWTCWTRTEYIRPTLYLPSSGLQSS